MFHAVLGYVTELESPTSDSPSRNIFEVKQNSHYAINQVRFEVRILIKLTLFLLKFTWFFLRFIFFWVPQNLLYQKYRKVVKNVPIASSALVLYETIIFMLYFES